VADDPGWFDDNRRFWDERVAIHAASRFYDVDAFVAGGPSPHVFPWMLDQIGSLEGLHVLHLQCHFGMDTLELARRGAASVTGLDFSGEAVGQARDLARRVGLEDRASFVEADVHDAPEALGGRTFDLVFTGIGAIGWLPSARRWAHVVARCTRVGGRLHFTEVHPASRVLADDGLSIAYRYLEHDEPDSFDSPGTYTDVADGVVTEHDAGHEWAHGLGDVVTALIGAGMRLDLLHERTTTFYQQLPILVEVAPGEWGVPPPAELPLLYSLLATRVR
jgi:SAM-dependent methyltransferase